VFSFRSCLTDLFMDSYTTYAYDHSSILGFKAMHSLPACSGALHDVRTIVHRRQVTI